MQRPVGVVLTAILLGVAALLLLMMAAVTVALIGHMPQTPGVPPPPPGLINGVFITLAVAYAALSAWAALTLVGLLRMKPWARISTLIIGGGVVLFASLGAAGSLLARSMPSPTTIPAGQNPDLLRIVTLITALVFLAVMAAAIGLIVYFSLRSTREAFRTAASHLAMTPLAHASAPSPYAASTYEVASYIDPAIAPPSAYVDPIVMPAPMSPSGRPLAISILGWLFIVGAALTLPYVFLPFPFFILGLTLRGNAAHATMLIFAILSGLVGVGLLRLHKAALYAACGLQFLGALNAALLFLPSIRYRMVAYQLEISQRMFLGLPAPSFDARTMSLMLLPGAFFGLIICGAVLALLFYNRAAFDTTPGSEASA